MCGFLILEDNKNRSQQPSPAKLVLTDKSMQSTINLLILFNQSVAYIVIVSYKSYILYISW